MKPIKTLEKNGHVVKLFQDETPESPREWDNLGTMLYLRGDYTLGDKEASAEEIRAIAERPDVICLKLYVYIHSGVTIRTMPFGCPWDSACVGIVYVETAKVLKEWKRKRMSKALMKTVLENLQCEVKTFDQYLQGDVYGFTIEKPNACKTCAHDEPIQVDSCWGFYGLEYAESEALSNVPDAA